MEPFTGMWKSSKGLNLSSMFKVPILQTFKFHQVYQFIVYQFIFYQFIVYQFIVYQFIVYQFVFIVYQVIVYQKTSI